MCFDETATTAAINAANENSNDIHIGATALVSADNGHRAHDGSHASAHDVLPLASRGVSTLRAHPLTSPFAPAVLRASALPLISDPMDKLIAIAKIAKLVCACVDVAQQQKDLEAARALAKQQQQQQQSGSSDSKAAAVAAREPMPRSSSTLTAPGSNVSGGIATGQSPFLSPRITAKQQQLRTGDEKLPFTGLNIDEDPFSLDNNTTPNAEKSNTANPEDSAPPAAVGASATTSAISAIVITESTVSTPAVAPIPHAASDSSAKANKPPPPRRPIIIGADDLLILFALILIRGGGSDTMAALHDTALAQRVLREAGDSGALRTDASALAYSGAVDSAESMSTVVGGTDGPLIPRNMLWTSWLRGNTRDDASNIETTGQPSDFVPAAAIVGVRCQLRMLRACRGGIPGLWAQLQMIEDYMPHKERFLMTGYYLATMQAAVELLLSHEPDPEAQEGAEGGSGEQRR